MPTTTITTFAHIRTAEELNLYFAFCELGYKPWRISQPIEDTKPAQTVSVKSKDERLQWLNEWKEQYAQSNHNEDQSVYNIVPKALADEFNVRFQLSEWDGVDIAEALAMMESKARTVH